MKLEVREHYPIKTPLINPYTVTEQFPNAYVALGSVLEKLKYRDPEGFHWHAPALSGRRFSSLRDFLAATAHISVIQWYDANCAEIEALRQRMLTLKAQKDWLFYTHGVLFTLGSLTTLPSRYRTLFPSVVAAVFCYCLDLPEKSFGDLLDLFCHDNHVSDEFYKYLPQPFAIWPRILNDGDYTPEVKQRNSENTILLFDFMVDLSVLVLKSCKDPALTRSRSGQIRCYYKWLKKNNIYLPRELQKKIHQDL